MEFASVLSLFAVPLFITTFLVYFTLNLTREAKKKRNNPPTPWTKALLWLIVLPYPLILYLIFYLLEKTERAVLGWLLLVGLFLNLLLLALGAYGLYKAGNRLDFLMSTLVSSFLMLFFVFIFDTAGANTYPRLSFLLVISSVDTLRKGVFNQKKKRNLFRLRFFILYFTLIYFSLKLAS